MPTPKNPFLVGCKHHRKRLTAWFFLITLFCLGSLTFAQSNPCDPHLKPTSDSVGYVFRNDRCEGLYVSPVSVHGGLELVSLTRGRLAYELEPGQHLILEAAGKGLEASEIQVRGVATPLRTYYRMDARLSPKESLRWPVDEVLLPLQLTAKRLGIFAWTVTTSGKVFVPLRLNRSASDDIHLLVRPTVSVQDVMWRLRYRQADEQKTTNWRSVVAQALAGETIPIVLTEKGRGMMTIEIAAVVENGSWSKLRMKVWHE